MKKFNPKIMHKPNYPFFERVFYRRIASILTPQIAKTNISPTTINFIGFFIGLIGISCIAFGDYPLRVIGAGILIISYIFDCVDGQLARGWNSTNNFGALLDTTLDSIKESMVFFALAWKYYLMTNNKYIFFYLATVLFLQRMFGRTLPWYRMLFKEDINEIKKDATKKIPKFLRPAAFFFSESYRSGTIWIVIFIGIVANKIIPTFIYFIIVILALFCFLLFNAHRLKTRKQEFIT